MPIRPTYAICPGDLIEVDVLGEHPADRLDPEPVDGSRDPPPGYRRIIWC